MDAAPACDLTSGCEDIWRAHLRSAVGDFRRLVAALRDGGLVVIFPEGELVTSGQLGPPQPGLASLVRRGRARLVQPVAISYDRLTPGRPAAYVSIAPALEPASGRLAEQFMESLRRAIPLTAGQIAATVLRHSGTSRELIQAGGEWVARAEAMGRPIEPALGDWRRGLALRRALQQARRRGADHELVTSMARELQTANATS